MPDGRPLKSSALIGRLQRGGMNAVLVARWESPSVGRSFARRARGIAVIRPRGASCNRTVSGACVIQARSIGEARAIGARRGVDMVVVRIRRAAEAARLDTPALRARVLAVITLPPSGAVPRDVLRFIRRAAASPKLDLSVVASGPRPSGALVRYFDAVSRTTAPLPAPTVFVAASGSDAGGCTRAAPCQSFDRAYHVAKAGAVVDVAAGVYPDQTLTTDETKTSTRDVVFLPAPGANVAVSGEIRIAAGKHVTFMGMSVLDWYVQGGSDDITFRDVHATYTFITGGASRINVLGGDIGPYNVCATGSGCPSAAMAISPQNSDPAGRPNHILIDGVNFHAITRDPGQHAQTMALWSADDVTIRNSRFTTCPVFCIFVANLDQPTPSQRVTIDHNTFDPGTDVAYSESAIYYFAYGLNITRNRFINAGMGPGDVTRYPSRNVVISGNRGSLRSCPRYSWITYGANVWGGGVKCP